jgi:hypothetical protein
MLAKTLSLAILACTASFASASLRINEIHINPPGSGDAGQGFEGFEIKSSSASASLSNVWIVVVENEGTNKGTIDYAVQLSGSTGTNSLAYVRDQASGGSLPTLVPAVNASSTLIQGQYTELENGGGNYILVSNFTGSLNQDLDTNDDGVLESTPWGTVHDFVFIPEAAVDSPGGNNNYRLSLSGSFTFVECAQQNAWTPDTFARLTDDEAIIADVTGTNPFPYDTNELVYATDSAAVSLVSGTLRLSLGKTGEYTVNRGTH